MKSTTCKWTSHLNKEQMIAANHDFGPQLILAGAGSGKTTVLVARTGRLIDKKIAKAENIVVLTFTNKAAKELKERVGHLLGKQGRKIWAGTFHSFGLNILKAHYKKANLPQGFGIIDASDAKSIIKQLLKDICHGTKDTFDVDKIISMISSWREKGQRKAQLEDEYHEIVEMLLPKYLTKLNLLGVTDFDGLILKPIEIFEKYPDVLDDVQSEISQLMVDEFQDTSLVQMKFVDMLAGKNKNITVVGDDDQSIYGWRGAQVKNILNFPNRYSGCKVVRLERNYRSKKAILDIANELISKNQDRHEKVLQASGYTETGDLPELFSYENENDEADEVVSQVQYFLSKGYSHKDIALLYRSNSQGGLVEAVLRRAQIPYKLNGGNTFFERKEVKDVLALLRCSLAPNEVSFRRIINVPQRGIGEKTIHLIQDFCEKNDISFFKAAVQWREYEISEKVGLKLEELFLILQSIPKIILDKTSSKSSGELLLDYLVEIGFKEYVLSSYKDRITGSKRWSLVELFSRVLDGFFARSGKSRIGLREFIDCMELRDQIEEQEDQSNQDKVQLMTLHASKGLEFPIVLIIGIEEEIIPHKTLGSDISEERRLFYVGLTRAKEHLVLSYARKRKRHGVWRKSAPSRFILDIPEQMIKNYLGPFRPVNEVERKSLLSHLYEKIEAKDSIKI